MGTSYCPLTHTETLLVRCEFDSLDEYVLFLQEVGAPIKNLLAGAG